MGYFLLPSSFRPALGSTQHPIQLVPGTVIQGIKRQGCEVDPSTPSSSKISNKRGYAFTPQYLFMAWCLIKQKVRLHRVMLN
jgi:hypothetical protein